METWLGEPEQQRRAMDYPSMTSIHVWVRTVRSLQFFLPCVKEHTDGFSIYYDVCSQVISLQSDLVRLEEFNEICTDKIDEHLVEAIFQNAVERGQDNSRSKLLVYSLLFAGLQQKSPGSEKSSRADTMLYNLKKHFGSVFKLLFQQDVGKRLQDRDIVHAIGSGQGFEFLDGLFEGTIRQKHGNSHGVRPLSHIVPMIMEKTDSISLPFLCNEIRRHLIKDPYHIDEFSSEKPIPIFSTARRTTLAHNSRRVVHLHFINKIELLRKDEFAGVHLRICNDKPKASFVFAPLKCETVFLDSLMYTRWIVLGAVRGVVIIRNCQSTRISVCCEQVIVIDSKHLEIHSMSPKKPLIYNSSMITFAPFNTVYEGQLEFLAQNEHSLETNFQLKEPINFGRGSWKLMDTSRFVCQNTPLHSTDKLFERLLYSLPEQYRMAHHRNHLEARSLVDECRVSDVVLNHDLLYLKSKIEKRSDHEDHFVD